MEFLLALAKASYYLCSFFSSLNTPFAVHTDQHSKKVLSIVCVIYTGTGNAKTHPERCVVASVAFAMKMLILQPTTP